jgi:hypothetical protein
MTSANRKDGTTKLAKVIAAVGAMGAACGAIILYVADFPRTLLTGFEVVSACTNSSSPPPRRWPRPSW